MKIKIAHLYYDLLNLYGEQGNILALKKAFDKQGVETKIDLLTIGDKFNLKKYDLCCLGAGSKENFLLVLEDIKKHQKNIKTAIDNDVYFIATGGAHELFGKFVEINKQKYPALNIFDYYAKQNPKAIVGDSLMDFKGLDPIIGFQNRARIMKNDTNHLFKVLNGFADNFVAECEGYHQNNFIGTYLIGPLLIRNPHLTEYIVKNILASKKIKYYAVKDTYEHQAYEAYLKNFQG